MRQAAPRLYSRILLLLLHVTAGLVYFKKRLKVRRDKLHFKGRGGASLLPVFVLCGGPTDSLSRTSYAQGATGPALKLIHI